MQGGRGDDEGLAKEADNMIDAVYEDESDEEN